jgi:2'-5' RNA ligase
VKKGLYFVAVIPPWDIQEEVTEFKMQAKVKFDSERALRSPAHITLFPPFRASEQTLIEIAKTIKEKAILTQPFKIHLSGFGAFRPRVIYINVQDSVDLISFQFNLNESLHRVLGSEDKSERPFHAHMTVAFKDLRKSMFKAAWPYFRQISYRRSWEIDAIFLLAHTGRVWEISQRFDFLMAR